jgi:PBP1b-binding outer membrane lipoprotein LpoB
MKTRTATFAAVAAAALLLSGCTAGAGGQSKADACTMLNDDMSSVSSELSSSIGSLQSDPSKASDAIHSLSDQLKKTSKKITNTDVKPAVGKVSTSLDAFSAQVDTYVDDPASVDVNKLSSSVTDFQSAISKVQKLCS